MKSITPYVYDIGIKLCSCIDETQALATLGLFQKVFIERFSSLIINHSHNFTHSSYQAEDFSGLVENRLSNLEREIFNIHRKQIRLMQLWRNKEVLQVEFNRDFFISRVNMNQILKWSLEQGQGCLMFDDDNEDDINRKRSKLL
jgi:hypothetical protein